MLSTSQLRFPPAIGSFFVIATSGAVVTVTQISALKLATPASRGIKAKDRMSGDYCR